MNALNNAINVVTALMPNVHASKDILVSDVKQFVMDTEMVKIVLIHVQLEHLQLQIKSFALVVQL
jgi:hypothetical protein